MALQHRREAAVRPRFLVALILSTVTAVSVAAPLALSGFGDDSGTVATFDPTANVSSDGVPVADPGAELNNILRQRTLDNGKPAVGGIGARARTKVQDQTHKAGNAQPDEPASPVTSLLTNATTVPVDPTVATTDTTAPVTVEPTTTSPTTTIPPTVTTDTQRPTSTTPTTDPGAGSSTTTRPTSTSAPDSSDTGNSTGNG